MREQYNLPGSLTTVGELGTAGDELGTAGDELDVAGDELDATGDESRPFCAKKSVRSCSFFRSFRNALINSISSMQKEEPINRVLIFVGQLFR